MLESGFYNMDCMLGMAQFPDKFFELAIVDPPFREQNNPTQWTRKGSNAQGTKRREMLNIGLPPDGEYFKELFRVSKQQIVHGGNYFTNFLPPNNNWIIWYKNNDGTIFSMAELFWSSIRKNVKVYDAWVTGASQGAKIHPTQKPASLYRWLLTNYAKPGDKILDTHVGSASSLIACHQMGFEYWGFELEADYYKAATERLNKAKAQVSMNELIEVTHGSL